MYSLVNARREARPFWESDRRDARCAMLEGRRGKGAGGVRAARRRLYTHFACSLSRPKKEIPICSMFRNWNWNLIVLDMNSNREEHSSRCGVETGRKAS
jgi:hypothetical protein